MKSNCLPKKIDTATKIIISNAGTYKNIRGIQHKKHFSENG